MRLPHVGSITFDGMAIECVIVKTDEDNGDVYYIRTDYLDEIDKSRMLTILSKRDAGRNPLWDVLYNTVLPNGVNALEYFDQYVKGITVTGKIFKPMPGRMGARVAAPQPVQAQVPQAQAVEKKVTAKAVKSEETPKV